MKINQITRKITGSRLLLFLLAITACFLLVFAIFPNGGTVNLNGDPSRQWNEGWMLEGRSVSLPYFAEAPKNQPISISKPIGAVFESGGAAISIMTSMQSLLVTVDGVPIYTYPVSENAYMDMPPPPAWHVVRLMPHMEGKILTIRYSSPLNGYGGMLNGIEIGSKFAVTSSFLLPRLFGIILCFILFLLGLISILIAVFLRHIMKDFGKLFYSGIFVCLMSLWSACETKGLQIITGNVQFLSALTFLSLMLAPIPLLLFFRTRFHGRSRKLYNCAILAFSFYFLAALALQGLGLIYFSSYFFLFLLLAFSCCVMIFVTLVIDYLKKNTLETKLYLFSMVILMVFALVDFIRFTLGRISLTSSGDSTRYLRIGVLLFTLTIGYLIARTLIGYYKNSVLASTYKELAHTDNLTGLYNRGYMQDVCTKLFSSSVRGGQSFALLLLDIDNFKPYNDHYGHVNGDNVLASVSEVLKEAIRRPLDSAIRFGGEEFLILLPDSSRSGAEYIAKRILKGVSALHIPHKHSNVSGIVTVSIGVYCAVPQRSATLEDFIALADSALYRAKSAGKNCYRVYKEGAAPPPLIQQAPIKPPADSSEAK